MLNKWHCDEGWFKIKLKELLDKVVEKRKKKVLSINCYITDDMVW